ncbi:NAD-dependent epimerase/dehydratase family protein [Allomuricauda sp. d1]|uniref:NAD-dependent epimerase/dehydratase family protein n=1 Tax=Allomuricauda sp. d1 TaxID=3136725 RepID=UPI0031D2FDDD
MVLVTGGTGLIGSHLLLELVKNGANVRAVYRNQDSIKKVERIFAYYGVSPKKVYENIQWVKANIVDVPRLEKAMDGIELVYHCAALISFDPKDYKKLVKTNVEGTKNVVNVSCAKGIKKLCYVSSIAALGTALKGKVIDEQNEWSDKNASVYATTKRNAELEVWRGMQEGLDAVIVNPGVVLGPGFWKSGSGTFFYHAAKERDKTVPGGTGFISVSDVIAVMMKLMAAEITNERFVLVEENTTFLDMMQRIAKNLGVKPPKKIYSFFQIEAFWRMDWARAHLFEKRRILSKNMAKSLYQMDSYSAKKVKDAIGVDFEGLEETIRLSARLFREDYPQLF